MGESKKVRDARSHTLTMKGVQLQMGDGPLGNPVDVEVSFEAKEAPRWREELAVQLEGLTDELKGEILDACAEIRQLKARVKARRKLIKHLRKLQG